jgi:anti-sigma-K factor RskA
MITCDHCREELAEYALGHSDVAVASAVAEHLAACVVCRRELAETEAAWSMLTLELPKVAPRSDVLAAVLDRIDRAEGPRPQPVAQVPERKPSILTPRQRLASYALAAMVAAALLAGALYMRPSGPGAVTADAALHDLAARLGKLQQLDRMLSAGNVRLASLRPPADGQTAAYVVWDLGARQWHFYAVGLPPAPADQAYQLWAVADDGAALPGPTFEVNAEGLGSTVANFPDLPPGTPARAAVTLEPTGGSSQPTSDAVLEATI